MNILFYFASQIAPTAGGVENVTAFWYNYLKSEGHNVNIVYWKSSLRDNVIHDQIGLPDKNCAYSKKNIEFLHRYLIDNNVNIIINQSGLNNRTSAVCAEAKRGTDSKLISVIHNTPYYLLKKYFLLKKLDKLPILKGLLRKSYGYLNRNLFKFNGKYIYENSDAVIVLSESYVEEYEALNVGHKSKKVFAVPNPITITSESDFSSKENIVLFVGRLTHEKGVDRLVESWNLLCKRGIVSNWKLYILGDGMLRKNLENKCKKLNLHNIIFTGNINPDPYYRRAKVFAMCSRFEGLPMTLLECQYYGVIPVIMDSYAAARDLVTDGYNGLLSDENIYNFSLKLGYILENQNIQRIMSINCKNEMIKFSPDKIYSQISSIVNHIIS